MIIFKRYVSKNQNYVLFKIKNVVNETEILEINFETIIPKHHNNINDLSSSRYRWRKLISVSIKNQ